jgi:hypothetical protein
VQEPCNRVALCMQHSRIQACCISLNVSSSEANWLRNRTYKIDQRVFVLQV